jgi:A/G-specific adenine glycosylase
MNEYDFFEQEILEWFEKNNRKHLPWRRENSTAYEVWVSEVMLQQTQVVRVIEYYNRFLEKFPTIFDLAQSHWEEFYPYYAGLGYYNRGRNMLLCAQTVVEKYNGIFPKTKKELMNLPGIGEYTASAILSFGYKQNELAIDTNVKKVFGRYFLGSKDEKVNFEDVKKRLFAPKKQVNAAIMDFANSTCLKVPRCGECPLQKHCEYYETDGRQEIVKKKDAKSFPTKSAIVYLTLHKNHKEYYSTNKKNWRPFVLPEKYNTRDGVKSYFQKKYSLTLSVRPPHKKSYVHGKPVLFVNAQILLGNHTFYIFHKKDIF